jgi:pyridoxine 5-phosphate synthase
VGQHNRLAPLVAALGKANIRVSMFVEPAKEQLDAAKALGAPVVELHTGAYANATGAARAVELARIRDAAAHGVRLGLQVHAGHGLTFDNVGPIAAIQQIVELNIGHFLIGEAIFVGLDASIREMRRLMDIGRGEAIGA